MGSGRKPRWLSLCCRAGAEAAARDLCLLHRGRQGEESRGGDGPDREAALGRSMNPLFANLPTTIFTRMSALAVEHRAVNLGQGFPDFGWPDDVVARAADALVHGSNQYA